MRPAEAVREAARDIIAGTIGGVAGRIIEYPFDTVKTKLQAASIGGWPQYAQPLVRPLRPPA